MTEPAPEEAATALNRRLRLQRADEPTSEAEPGTPDYAVRQLQSGAVQTHAQRLVAQALLPDTPTVADIAPLRGLAGVPVVGGALSFARELAGALWFLLHRRAPFSQQIRFNRAVSDAFAHLQDLGDIHLRLDRELQQLKSEMGASELVSLQESDALGQRLKELEERLTRLEALLQQAAANQNAPQSPRTTPDA